MNYLHAYHAGSFADVVKHTLLVTLLESLQRKETPFCYLDTHAGAGYYDLSSAAAQKSKEYLSGITKLLQAENVPAAIQPYLDFVKHFGAQFGHCADANIRHYPGSPSIAYHFARPQDRLILCELHGETYHLLKKLFAHHKQAAVHQTDGFSALKAFLPPKERRGLILIDPPYEQPDEFDHINTFLRSVFPHFDTGIYAIWYPLKNKMAVSHFKKNLAEQIQKPILCAELSIYTADASHQLNGCGLLIINAPWQFEQTIQGFFPWMWERLKIDRKSTFSVGLLKK
jgi:23S rRNA (adenine2030-N6)-methyltransferase